MLTLFPGLWPLFPPHLALKSYPCNPATPLPGLKLALGPLPIWHLQTPPPCLVLAAGVHMNVDVLEARPGVTSQLSSLGLGSFGAVGGVWAATLCREQRQPAHSWSSPEGTSQRHCHRRLKVQTGTLWSRRSLPFFPRVAREFCGQTWDGGQSWAPELPRNFWRPSSRHRHGKCAVR